MSLGELYGEYDLSTNEWTDGVLSSIMRAACAGEHCKVTTVQSFIWCNMMMMMTTMMVFLPEDETPDEKWIMFDGPVDTLWIESMNSVMDDNKVLTLINGDRISMPEQVREHE